LRDFPHTNISRVRILKTRDSLSDPHSVAKAQSSAIDQSATDALNPICLTSVHGHRKHLPSEQVEGVGHPGRRKTGLRARDVEPDYASVSVAKREPRNLKTQIEVPHGAHQLTHPDSAPGIGDLFDTLLQTRLDCLHSLVQAQASGEVLLWSPPDLAIDNTVIG
jgi:hypothetical protein